MTDRRVTVHPSTAALLTPRQREIVELFMSGRCTSNDEVAAKLGISTSTVKTLVSRAMTSTGTSTRLALVLRAMEGMPK